MDKKCPKGTDLIKMLFNIIFSFQENIRKSVWIIKANIVVIKFYEIKCASERILQILALSSRRISDLLWEVPAL